MAIDFNTAPYYDDFDKANNFYRILFKPGRSVQARELTQLQTSLQNQIEQFGKNIFKDGALISGGNSFVSTGQFLKIASTSTNLSAFDRATIVGSTSGAVGIVRLYDVERTIDSVTYPDTLYIASTSGLFQAGEEITIQNTSTTATLAASDHIGPAYFFSIDESVFFVKGHFVYCASQTVVLSKTFDTDPSARLGLEITDGIYTSDDDATLLDPAVGASNYFAPGADRYYIDLTLKAINYDPDVEDSDTTTINEFIEVANYRKGVILTQLRNTQYNILEDTLARRTFDESGNYTVRPFTVKVRDHVFGNVDKLTVEISPGKAYVKGYEFETSTSRFITMDRARDYETVEDFPFSADYGRYVIVDGAGGNYNTHNSHIVHLHKEKYGNILFTSNANYFSNVIGTARARYFEQDSAATSTYKLYLFDIKLDGSNTFGNTVSIVGVTNPNNVTVAANVTAFSNIYGNATIVYGTDDSLLFKLPQKRIKTFANATFTSQRLFTNQSFSPSGGNSIATITLTGSEYFVGTGTLSDDAINARFFAAVTATSNTTTFPLNKVLTFYGNTGNVYISSPQTAIISVTGNDSFSANIVALTTTTNTPSKTKTLANSNVVIQYTSNLYDISLGVSDVFRITGIDDYTGNSYIGRYDLDTGQRDDFYDYGRAILKADAIVPTLNSITNPNITITFQHFTHSGTGYFDVDSYNINYSDVPSYKNTNGEVVSLTDVVDFRPVRPAASNALSSTNLIQPGSTFFGDYEYYLPRIDKLVLTKERRFKVVKGISSTSPSIPDDLPDAMTLYTFGLPAYTASKTDVQSTYFEHKRYTMRDIGKIERRVERVEYYTALSLLEKIAADEEIISSLTGVDRFKNGILVDPFTGHSVGDVNNGDYRCSIDKIYRTLRPRTTQESYGYFLEPSGSTYFTKTGDLVTANYTTANHISQLKATGVISLVPFEVFNWVGRMTLDPSTDVWYDTITAPDVVVNLNGENDGFTQITLDKTGLSPMGTVYSNWQTVSRGISDISVSTTAATTVTNDVNVDWAGTISVTPTATTTTATSVATTTTQTQAQIGLQYSSGTKTITTNLGSKIVDSSIVPYIRPRRIKFEANGLKPNTRLYATFDGIDVTEYCRGSVDVVFTSNVLPEGNVIANVTAVTQNTGWSGEIISIKRKRKRIKVIPDTSYYLPETGNVLSFANSAISAVVQSVTVPQEVDDLITDETGSIAGVFFVPNDEQFKFNIGERAFRLADSLKNEFVTTSAETKYLAYGISNTKENTVLATRVNLVSITPTIQTRTSSTVNPTTTTTTTGTTTTGTSDSAIIPGVVDITNTSLFCGSNVRGNGARGKHTFVVHLGPGTGRGNIVCNSGIVPDRFTLEYGGHVQTTGFMTSAASSASITSYNEQLKNLDLPEATRYSASDVKLSFVKMTSGNAIARVTVDAPLVGTGWNLRVECPSVGIAATGATASLRCAPITNPQITDLYLWSPGGFTSAIDFHHFITITNTSRQAAYNTGYVDNKQIVVKGFDVILPSSSGGGVTASAVTATGTYSTIVSGTYNGLTSATDTNVAITLGTGDQTLNLDESRVFAFRINKPAGGFINGSVRVRPRIESPTGNSVPCNELFVPFSTQAEPPPPNPDPLAQSFFISDSQTPNGIFVSSIDAFFYEKDPLVPVTCEIRPVVNGYPSSREIIPFATVTIDADDVVTSSTPDVTKNTRFTFPGPVYLPPGEYAFVLFAPSTKYRAFTATLGEYLLDDADVRVTSQPYVGSLFASQNASTWTAEQNEDLMFRINRCMFDTGNVASIQLKTVAPSNNVEYDVFYTAGESVDFADTQVEYKYKSTPLSTGTTAASFIPFNLGLNHPEIERKLIKKNDSDSLQLQINMRTNDDRISPVIDLNRLETVLARNVVNNDATGEDSLSGGNAKAKYITRKVVLNPGFEAVDLKVYFNAFCPVDSSVKVYYKVNAPGTTQFDSQNEYVEMTNISISGNQRAGFAEYTVGTVDGQCLTDGARFNTFTIKIVMLSDDTVYVPIIRDLRVIALDD